MDIQGKPAECSKVEFQAQKQNKVEQNQLVDRMSEIEKELTLNRLAHRMMAKQLRYEIAQIKKTTGHSQEGRPPTGQPDLRKRKSIIRLPPLLESIPEQSHYTKNNTEEKNNRNITESKEFGGESTAPRELQSDNPDVKLLTTSITSIKETVIEQHNPISGNLRGKDVLQHNQSGMMERNKHRKNSQAGLDTRVHEPKNLMSLPSIYQTLEMKSNRKMHMQNRIVPPLAVQHANTYLSPPRATNENDDSKHNSKEINRISIAEQTSTTENPEESTHRTSTYAESTHKESTHTESTHTESTHTESKNGRKGQVSKKLEIAEIIQESLKRAAKTRAQKKRKKEEERLKHELAIERPVGLYRPDNMKLIHKTFKREDLYKTHKDLLEQNQNKNHIPISALVGSANVGLKVQQFLSKK